MIKIANNKDRLTQTDRNNDNIYLFLQFFIHYNKDRNKELLFCLKQNINLNCFSQIFLLNERLYTKEELGLNENEMKIITQINIGERLKFNVLFLKMKQLKLKGYFIFCNSDIFFDKSIYNLYKTSLSVKRSIYALLRFEYKSEIPLEQCKLFTFFKNNKPRHDSQDTWIIHSNYLPDNIFEETNFEFGKLGCDNKICYIFFKNDYICFNEPLKIRTYHYHTTQIRDYSIKDKIPGPYLLLIPNF